MSSRTGYELPATADVWAVIVNELFTLVDKAPLLLELPLTTPTTKAGMFEARLAVLHTIPCEWDGTVISVATGNVKTMLDDANADKRDKLDKKTITSASHRSLIHPTLFTNPTKKDAAII